MESDEQHTISGLLRKRVELQRENVECRERMAVIANDIEAIDRVLDTFGYQGELDGRTPRAARIILFYRNELRQFLQRELARAGRPISPLRKRRFQFAVGVMAMVTTSAAGLASMTAIRPKTSRASVCKTKMKATRASAASFGVP